VFDLLILILLFGAFAAAAVYIQGCLSLTRLAQPKAGDSR
jgi:hypothetical protein